jgi:uncharacterized protein
MPQWGLTKDQRGSRPWGIPESWLRPEKVITDPIHGDVFVSRLEAAIIDSKPFQRLRRIRQLGNVHLVYPGATHTRFSHALGALRVVQDLLDIILSQRDGRDPGEDLFQQWEETKSKEEFDREVAEVIVLARLGSLLHDLTHVAYGHTIEDDLGLLCSHDKNPARFGGFWRELGNGCPRQEAAEVRKILRQKELRQAIGAIILAKRKKKAPDELLREMGKYPFVADLVTNTICADLLDYLPRDHAYSGLPLALGQRFMTAFYVVPAAGLEEERHFPERMALRIAPRGRKRQDIASELLKHLRYRYELQERTIVHHAKLAADSMLGKALELWRDELWTDSAREAAATPVRHAVETGGGVDRVRLAVRNAKGGKEESKLDKKVSKEIERRVRRLGDDSLLEYLSGEIDGGQASGPKDRRVRELAGDLLDRRLYKRAAQAKEPLSKKRVFDLFGDRQVRRKLERQAADYAGVPEEQVVIWLPDPKMRLKIAEVLVDHGTGIAPFHEYSPRGNEIYEDHKALWTVTVFVHREIRNSDLEPVILARLAELMEIEWDRHKPPKAEKPQDWPLCLAISTLLKENLFEKELTQLLNTAREKQTLHRKEADTFKALKMSVAPTVRSFGRKNGSS